MANCLFSMFVCFLNGHSSNPLVTKWPLGKKSSFLHFFFQMFLFEIALLQKAQKEKKILFLYGLVFTWPFCGGQSAGEPPLNWQSRSPLFKIKKFFLSLSSRCMHEKLKSFYSAWAEKLVIDQTVFASVCLCIGLIR